MADPSTSAAVRGRPQDDDTDGTRRLLRSVPVAGPDDGDAAAVARRIVEEVLAEHRGSEATPAAGQPEGGSPSGSGTTNPTRPRPDAAAPAATRPSPVADRRSGATAPPTPSVQAAPSPVGSAADVVRRSPWRWLLDPGSSQRWLVVLAVGLFAYVVTLVLGMGALRGVFEGQLSGEAPAVPAAPAPGSTPGDLPAAPDQGA